MKSWRAKTAVIAACAWFAACATNPPLRVPASGPFDGTDGAVPSIVPSRGDEYTVVIFFSAGCHVLAAHDERVREIAAEFGPRGVRFLGVDSEVGATLDGDRAEVEKRRYPFPIVLDRGGELARELGAAYAGYTVVLDVEGNVRYRGGIDSDRVRLRDDAKFYLRDALADLVTGRAPRVAESKALGCALRLR